jgi:hypothetical protein
METRAVLIPGPDHPITIDADADTVRVVARVGDTVIADTKAALTLHETGYPPVQYVPLDDVVPGTTGCNHLTLDLHGSFRIACPSQDLGRGVVADIAIQRQLCRSQHAGRARSDKVRR